MNTLSVPQCQLCGQPMVWSLALRGNEYVCVPCGVGVPVFNDLPTVVVGEDAHDALRAKYAQDLHAVTVVRHCEGKCAGAVNGTWCAYGLCPIPTDFKYQYFGNGPSAPGSKPPGARLCGCRFDPGHGHRVWQCTYHLLDEFAVEVAARFESARQASAFGLGPSFLPQKALRAVWVAVHLARMKFHKSEENHA